MTKASHFAGWPYKGCGATNARSYAESGRARNSEELQAERAARHAMREAWDSLGEVGIAYHRLQNAMVYLDEWEALGLRIKSLENRAISSPEHVRTHCLEYISAAEAVVEDFRTMLRCLSDKAESPLEASFYCYVRHEFDVAYEQGVLQKSGSTPDEVCKRFLQQALREAKNTLRQESGKRKLSEYQVATLERQYSPAISVEWQKKLRNVKE